MALANQSGASAATDRAMPIASTTAPPPRMRPAPPEPRLGRMPCNNRTAPQHPRLKAPYLIRHSNQVRMAMPPYPLASPETRAL